MDPKPEDIAAVLAGNQTVGEPGAPVTGHLWNEYWKEVGRWAPWMALAVPPANMAGRTSLTGLRPWGASRPAPDVPNATYLPAKPDPMMRPGVFPSNPAAGVPELNDWAAVQSASKPPQVMQNLGNTPWTENGQWTTAPNANYNTSPLMEKLIADMKAHNARAQWNVIKKPPNE